MPNSKQTADRHQREARRLLEQAQSAVDLETRDLLIDLCEQELVAAVSARHSKMRPLLKRSLERRKTMRRKSDILLALGQGMQTEEKKGPYFA